MRADGQSFSTIVVAAAIGGAAVLTFAGVRLSPDTAAVIRAGEMDARKGWESVPAISIPTHVTRPDQPRLVTVQCASVGEDVQLAFEWADSTKDWSFDGAYDDWAVNRQDAKVQETALRRDELHVWFGTDKEGVAHGSVLLGERRHGLWCWKSQWQNDTEQNPIGTVRKEFGLPSSDQYPVQGDGAYSARYVENSNAITQSASPVMWKSSNPVNVYQGADIRELFGQGEWTQGRWRVVFRVPRKELASVGSRIKVCMAVADGGLGTSEAGLAVSQRVTIEIPEGATASRMAGR